MALRGANRSPPQHPQTLTLTFGPLRRRLLLPFPHQCSGRVILQWRWGCFLSPFDMCLLFIATGFASQLGGAGLRVGNLKGQGSLFLFGLFAWMPGLILVGGRSARLAFVVFVLVMGHLILYPLASKTCLGSIRFGYTYLLLSCLSDAGVDWFVALHYCCYCTAWDRSVKIGKRGIRVRRVSE
ncbi:hypothetical protein F5B21DRAFT_219705 [Xylaria acuta]|nr:hypothetical protein F5B21DRAFT_219705 [Xylaria acuta]